MQNNQVIALFGAGYIGRYLVPELCKAGYRTKIGSRNPHRKNYLRGNPGQVELFKTNLKNPEDIIISIFGAFFLLWP